MVKISKSNGFDFHHLIAIEYLAKKSKRVSCAHRYSIAKKVRAHNKKMRREARKHPEFKSKSISEPIHEFIAEYLEKKPKDIKIPKLAPFKDELLKQAEEAKRQVCFSFERKKLFFEFHL